MGHAYAAGIPAARSVVPALAYRRRGILAAIVLLATTFYQVQPEAVGVVLRFGRYVRTTDPGLHMKARLPKRSSRCPSSAS